MLIFRFFKNRKLFRFCIPCHPDKLRLLASEDEELSHQFEVDMDRFCKHIRSTVKPKQLGDSAISNGKGKVDVHSSYLILTLYYIMTYLMLSTCHSYRTGFGRSTGHPVTRKRPLDVYVDVLSRILRLLGRLIHVCRNHLVKYSPPCHTGCL